MYSFGKLLDKWKTDPDFRVWAAGLLSFAVTAVFALYNAYLGVHNASLWYGTFSVYYILLSALRGLILAVWRRRVRDDDPTSRERKTVLVSAALLLLLNVSLVIPISLMVEQRRPVSMTLTASIAVAAYTT